MRFRMIRLSASSTMVVAKDTMPIDSCAPSIGGTRSFRNELNSSSVAVTAPAAEATMPVRPAKGDDAALSAMRAAACELSRMGRTSRWR